MTDVLRRPATPWHLWLVGVLSLLWNMLGAWQWFQQVTGAPAYWNSLTAVEAAYLRAAPLWTDVAYGLAVWGGLFGALLLLVRRREATAAFALALAGMIADSAYVYLMSNGREVMGAAGAVFVLVLIGVLAAQTFYCARMRRRGVIV